MKDFIKTNEFVRNANAFSDLLLKFWHDLDGERAMPIGETLDTLKELKGKTWLKGEVLAQEVLEVCPDIKDLQFYFDQWTKRLDLIDTCFVDFYMDDELKFELGLRLDDEQAYLFLQGIISGMNMSYNDVMDGKTWLAKTYSLQVEDDTDDSMSDFRTSANLIEVEKKPKNSHPFRNLIQYDDPDALLNRLHVLIDGNGGAAVGSVIRKAIDEGYLMDEPTKAEFESEFSLEGSWQAIHNYFHFEGDNNKLIKASRIVIF